MKGKLDGAPCEVEIETSCAQSGRPMRIKLDSALRWEVLEGGERPVFFEPNVDWTTFNESNIIHRY